MTTPAVVTTGQDWVLPVQLVEDGVAVDLTGDTIKAAIPAAQAAIDKAIAETAAAKPVPENPQPAMPPELHRDFQIVAGAAGTASALLAAINAEDGVAAVNQINGEVK